MEGVREEGGSIEEGVEGPRVAGGEGMSTRWKGAVEELREVERR